ncbi:class I SAM-dependent methyltransferase [Bradyrhizobium sp. WYCCWR 13023]|uniref:Class I SAM-dependent methyltransferase n=1 Tax=Bradyrhizobium zhengyangense TaxID=2911009 RepID=A0A9X1RFN4_9BRAD|nr:class I SAM-dependent methyltransferase [Bradyrhizobium zhengyangense]MCG2630710.1 class I SAM-dependent methyltransferase [Bradyrhizobium zhengyangense]
MVSLPPPTTLVWDEATLSRFWAFHSQFSENYFSHQKGKSLVAYAKRYLPEGATVLDYGCGPGHLLPRLLDAGFVVQGADIARDTIGSAVSLSGQKSFLGFATIDELLAEGKTFDAIFLIEVVEHLDDFWLAKTLDQVHALLKKGGTLIVTTPNEENLQDNMVYCPVSNTVFHRWQHMRSWSESTLAAALAAHGFGDVRTETRTFDGGKPTSISYLRYLTSRITARLRKAQSLIAVARA